MEKLRKIILNHVLFQNDWMSTRLKKFHNKTILITISELSMYFSVNKKGLLEHIGHVKNPDASISMPIKSLINQILHKENKDITIKGDIDLAREVSEILKKIKWDVEEDLSKGFLDVPIDLSLDILSFSNSLATFISEICLDTLSIILSSYSSTSLGSCFVTLTRGL